MQAYSLISKSEDLSAEFTFYPGSLNMSIYVAFHIPGEQKAQQPFSMVGTYQTHCHLCPTRYSFIPE